MSQHSADPDPGGQNSRTLPEPLAIGGTSSAETTSLERRVLAHERILQSLIAHMSEREPTFILRLKERFTEPMRLARREHDYSGTDDYAEEFINAVVRLSEGTPKLNGPTPEQRARNIPAISSAANVPYDNPVQPTGAVIRNRSGIWEVTINGHFHGDYLREEHAAEAAVAALRLAVSGPADRTS